MQWKTAQRNTTQRRPRSAGGRRLSRQGITLVEVIVIIAIVLVLAGLLLPWTGTVRYSARRARCGNSLRQLGLALHNYHDAFSRFPAAFGSPTFATAEEPENRGRLSGNILLLPYLEQNALWEQIASPFESNGRHYPAFGPNVHDSNYQPWQQSLPVFQCPADSILTPAPSSYAYCIGMQTQKIHQQATQDLQQRGVFAFGVEPTLGMISDGASNTIMMSEMGPGPQRLLGGGWEVGATTKDLKLAGQHAKFLIDPQHPDQYRTTVALSAEPRGARWFDGAAPSTLFQTVLSPGQPSFAVGAGELPDGVFSAKSSHSNSVNVLYADGSVASIIDEINLEVWQALGTISGGEAVSANDY